MLTGEGDIWYFQKRIGYQNREFDIWKFATMLRDSPNMLTGTITLRNDPRVTKVGKFLRTSKLNEVPQLINVLLGEMALVGPRPVLSQGFLAYPQHVQERIYDIRPGVTGIGSIFFRDEEAFLSRVESPRKFYNDIIAPYKGELELWYQRNMSPVTDIKILLLTILVVIFPRLRMQEFFDGLPAVPAALASHEE